MTDPTPTPTPDSSSRSRFLDLRRLPPGVVPRHLQRWVLMGIAAVMIGILALSGPAPKPLATAPASPAAVAIDPNQRRIEEYQRRIQEQAQRLATEQAQLQLTKEELDPQPEASPSGGRVSDDDTLRASASAPLERDDRTEHARSADNVAFSRTPPAQTITPPAQPASASPTQPALSPAASTLPNLPASPPTVTPAPPSAFAMPAQPASPGLLAQFGRYRLYEGTVIETVLTNRLDATFNGPVNGMVSVPVYASDHLVIPAGARVLGEARAVNTFGQTRVAVAFHRVVLPNGQSISLDNFQGLNQAGDLGLRDQVNRHYAQIFGVSLALGAIAGFAQGHSAVGLDATAVDTYRQGIGANVSQSSARILDRFLNVLPTVTIREGHRIKVYLSQDLELPAYPSVLTSSGGHR